MPTELAETLRRLKRYGWAPVRWAHHRPEIKELIRRGCFRPKAKSCFENCSRLVLAALDTEHEARLRYCEGWVTTVMKMPHAWLLYDGELVEMTLVGRDVIYDGGYEILTPEQVRESCLRTRRYGPHASVQSVVPDTIDEIRRLRAGLIWETT